MEFKLGANYCDSAHGTEMRKNFNAEVVEKNLLAILGGANAILKGDGAFYYGVKSRQGGKNGNNF